MVNPRKRQLAAALAAPAAAVLLALALVSAAPAAPGHRRRLDISQMPAHAPRRGQAFYHGAGLAQLSAVAAAARAAPVASTQAAARSRVAYRDLSATGAGALFARHFGHWLGAPYSPTAPGGMLRGFIDAHRAVLSAAGRTEITVSSLPLATERGNRLQAVALDLRRSGRRFVAANPLTGVSLPMAARGAAWLTRLGIGISLSGARRAGAEILRGSPATAFYARVSTDTDLMARPTAEGLELAVQLRSARSPTLQRFRLRLPHGARIAPYEGGALILRGGRRVAAIEPPEAVDAIGHPVRVRLSVSGRTVLVGERPIAATEYPVLADPTVVASVDAEQGQYGGWKSSTNDPQTPNGTGYAFRGNCYVPISCETQNSGNPNGDGLYIYAYEYATYPANAFGEWMFAPSLNGGYITNVQGGDFSWNRHGDTGANPFAFVGLWSNADNGWDGIQTWPTEDFTNNSFSVSANPGDDTAVSADIGISTAATETLSSWREIAVGYVQTTYVVPASSSGSSGSQPTTLAPPATPTPPTGATAPPSLRRLHVRVTISWTWTSAGTRLRRAKLRGFPAGATIIVRCKGRGCFAGSRRAGQRRLHRLWKGLQTQRFRPGDRITLTITKPGWLPERGLIRIRANAVPTARLVG